MNAEASDLLIGLPMDVLGSLGLRLSSGAQDGETWPDPPPLRPRGCRARQHGSVALLMSLVRQPEDRAARLHAARRRTSRSHSRANQG